MSTDVPQTSESALTVPADPRLAAVRKYTDQLGAPADGSFNRIAAMAAKIFDTPIATVSIVDEDRVWFAATQGLDGVRQVGTEPGLCASVVHADGPYVVHDAANDPRTAEHPLVTGDLGLRFYAAAPIEVEGHALGTVNVIDQKSRPQLDPVQVSLLADLAATVAQLMEVRLIALTAMKARTVIKV
ncbi:GAF domain-containing protein [Kineosporia sp. J2-2]|uniref:GAF domain-containing protein n=1 Tax=Kineosporia corallincola TaxID=2835133 RepID=A0ABS5TP70_9ACTN|nr:GAF domain-containing protein [Kineosporia corallincola]MBT0772169.1 GAF domain-containing protein [Kineosporia corallincola]